MECDVYIRIDLFSNVVFSGGTTVFTDIMAATNTARLLSDFFGDDAVGEWQLGDCGPEPFLENSVHVTRHQDLAVRALSSQTIF